MIQNVNLLSVIEIDIVSKLGVKHLTFHFCYILKLDGKEAVLESSNISPIIAT